jgi:hypothetical protein
MKPMPAFPGVFQLEVQAVLIRKKGRTPSEGLVGRIRVSVGSDGDIARLMNQPMFLYVSVAEKKITAKVGLEPPEYIDRNRYEVNQFERLSASFFRFDSVYHSLFVEQLLIIGLSGGRMNGQTNEAIQKNECYRAQ